MRRSTLPLAIALASLFGLLVAMPASAATTGTVCGQVTAFTAPVGPATNGSITIDGTVETIDATASIAADTIVTLTTVADADATTCVNITADGAGVITAIDIAAQAEVCGTAALDTTTGIYSVGGVDLPASIVSANANLMSYIDAAADANASVCVNVTIDGVSGLITTVRLNATLTLCGDATVDADSTTLAGVDVPLSLLDADAEAVLAVAIDAGADVCLQLVIANNALVQANLSANVDLCGDVTLTAGGDAVVDGTVIPDALLTADAAALLSLAATADGTACASVDAASSGGDTTVGVTVTIDVCAEVTAVTDGTITLEGVTLIFAGAADADITVGDTVCVTAGTGPTGDGVVTGFDGDGGVDAGGRTTDGAGMLPDTALPTSVDLAAIGTLLLFGLGIGLSATRQHVSRQR